MTQAEFAEQEERRATEYIQTLPENVRGYYYPMFMLGDGPHREGTFGGVSCKVCDRWIEFGHAPNCPANRIAGKRMLKPYKYNVPEDTLLGWAQNKH